jgi:hypothetical protein
MDCYYGVGDLSDDEANISAVLRNTLNYPSNETWVGANGGETGDLCISQSVAEIAVQPRGQSHWKQTAIMHLSNAANSGGGACVYARATGADYFSVGATGGHLLHQHVTADTSPSASPPGP